MVVGTMQRLDHLGGCDNAGPGTFGWLSRCSAWTIGVVMTMQHLEHLGGCDNAGPGTFGWLLVVFTHQANSRFIFGMILPSLSSK